MDTFINDLFRGLERAYKDEIADQVADQDRYDWLPELTGTQCEINKDGTVVNMQVADDGQYKRYLGAGAAAIQELINEGIDFGARGVDKTVLVHVRIKMRIHLNNTVTVTCSPRNSWEDLRAYLRSTGFKDTMGPKPAALLASTRAQYVPGRF